MKRRVLLIDLGTHFGGVENYLINLVELLTDRLDIYALCVLPELHSRLSSCGVHVIRIPRFPNILKPVRFLVAVLILPFVLIAFRIRVVQVNGFLESILIPLARLLGRRVIYTRHGPFETDLYHWYERPLKFLPRKAAQVNVRFASHVVCVSAAVARSMQSVLPVDRYSIIPNWVPSHRVGRRMRSGTIAPRKVLCASRLEQYKGVQLVIEAARNIPELQFTIAGDGGFRASLENQAKGLNNVRIAGFQKNLEPLYESCDIFVMPSLGPEGLPMVSLEAMAEGLVCVFSDLPVHQEITDGGKGACLFELGSGRSLTMALLALINSPDSCQRFVDEAQRIIHSRYTRDSVQHPYYRLFAEESF
jgi:glycosyltransferase involved in cell wall biosynthesis